MIRRRRHEQEGQVALALLLVVVALLFLGFAFAQVGSAGDQAVQTQTAADSAAVAAGHRLREATLSTTVHELLPAAFAFGAPLAAPVPFVTLAGLDGVACAAAVANWGDNPHRSGLGCGDVTTSAAAGEVTSGVTGPAGEVSGAGPVDTAGIGSQKQTTARVLVADCPVAAASAQGQAVADWIAQTAAEQLGTPAPVCFTPADATVLAQLALLPVPAQVAAVGPLAPLLDAAEQGMRVEIVR
jgi:Flp pilus assembly protein TadG